MHTLLRNTLLFDSSDSTGDSPAGVQQGACGGELTGNTEFNNQLAPGTIQNCSAQFKMFLRPLRSGLICHLEDYGNRRKKLFLASASLIWLHVFLAW